jgi:hypothetical protein
MGVNTILAGSGKMGWWRCPDHNHSWQAQVYGRAQGNGCPYCGGKKALAGFNDLATLHPALAKSWHPSRNYLLTPREVTAGSSQTVWWVCSCGRDWQIPVKKRVKTQSCRHCCGKQIGQAIRKNSRQRALAGESLLHRHPDIAYFWDSLVNGALTPNHVTSGCHQVVGWQAVGCSHQWTRSIKRQVRAGARCPLCRGSGLESAVLFHLKLLTQENILTHRRPLQGRGKSRLELDLWLPTLKLAFEVQDFATHHPSSDTQISTLNWLPGVDLKHGPTYHKMKRELAHQQLGVRLVDLWEDQIRGDALPELLAHELDCARKCHPVSLPIAIDEVP